MDKRLALDKAWLEDTSISKFRAGFGVQLLHEEEDHNLAVFAVGWLPSVERHRITTAPGR